MVEQNNAKLDACVVGAVAEHQGVPFYRIVLRLGGDMANATDYRRVDRALQRLRKAGKLGCKHRLWYLKEEE